VAGRGRPYLTNFFSHLCETHLPAERSTPETPARIPRADVDPRRPRDPQAPPRQGAQAPVGVDRPVERRQRLSRSRDFDAVYRQGRSVSTRSVTLHWFAREDDADGPPRLGLAVPRAVGTAVTRNRVKRQLRAVWSELGDSVPPGRDYVLVARPGLAEAARSRDHAWLVDQVREVIGKVQA
jgi:ribonuclease P protein component